MSAESDAFLSAGTPSGLAKLLLGQSYSRFRRLIYPTPRYTTFTLKKRLGGTRTIDAPAALLKSVQRKLATVLLEIYGQGKPSVHSFVRKRSIVSNAWRHSHNKKFILNIDLEDFFGTIHFGRVRGVFQKPPFSFPSSAATVLAHLCCYKSRLPQGAPTSPVIANFVARALDTDLQDLARSNHATYTRYCDDITFSFSVRTSQNLPLPLVNIASTSLVGESLARVIAAHSFGINSKKVRLRGRSQRLEVTGLTVNEFPNVQRRFVHEIRGALHAWKAHGLAKAQSAFEPRYKRQLRTAITPKLESVIRGKLLFLRMVRGHDDKIYTRLAESFNDLLSKEGASTPLPLVKRVRDADDLAKAVFVLECHSKTSGGDIIYRQGTAFLLEDVGLVTCEHVLRKNNATSEQEIIYFGAAPEDRVVVSNPALGYMERAVKVRSTDLKSDIGTLLIPADLPITARSLHLRVSAPRAGEAVKLAGFPNYSPGRKVMIVDTKSLGLYPKFGLTHFEIETLIRAGNSGGPVLDADFYVVGLAKEGAKQDEGNNGAIVSAEIRALTSPPPKVA